MARRPGRRGSAQLTTTLHISSDESTDPLPAELLATLYEIGDQVQRDHEVPDEVQLVLIDDAYMSHLNTAYRKKNGTTDVLSFSLGSTPNGASLGEIYISLPQAKRQAIALNASLLEELARLLVHGLLHLAGWTHDTPTQLEAMQRETETILNAADLAVYS